MKTLTREEIENIETTNFIEAAIKQDMLEQGLDHIVTRFPPEPNGFPHIGHIKACNIDYSMKEKFGGYMNLRMDDTNPLKESVEYENAIIEALKWCGFKWSRICYASDYYEQMYDCAVLLIKKGLAYVDDIDAETLSRYRGSLTEPGTESPSRSRSIEENLRMFQDMRDGKYDDGEVVLRAKIDMASPNMNMRDPTLYRVLRANHYRTGDKWCIYPMYDFAHPISDAIEGITHSMCDLDFENHRPLYDWVVRECEFANPPRQIEFSRLNIQGTVTGKRYLRKLVEDKLVTGWDDPRLPTISGLRNRGVPSVALIDFVKRVGVTKVEDALISPEVLDSCIRDILNTTATRAMVVMDPIKLTITNYNNIDGEMLEFVDNPNNEDSDTHWMKFGRNLYIEREDFMIDPPGKYHRLKPDGYVRLRGAYIVKCNDYIRDANGNVTEVLCTYEPASKSGNDPSGIKDKGTIHWVNADDCDDIYIQELSSLVKPGVVFDGDWDIAFNTDSLRVVRAKAEKFVLTR
ncbi:MAG: glutamine--tRNA ligase, partial [Clostridia bacterium]|nr:glutamine--tRNA ligase [Clostridia bacterium]